MEVLSLESAFHLVSKLQFKQHRTKGNCEKKCSAGSFYRS